MIDDDFENDDLEWHILKNTMNGSQRIQKRLATR
jgi:hypothetical protein